MDNIEKLKELVVDDYQYFQGNFLTKRLNRLKYYQEIYVEDSYTNMCWYTFDSFIKYLENESTIRKVLKGEKGSGKTLFLEQIRYKWAISDSPILKKIDKIFYIDLRSYTFKTSISVLVKNLTHWCDETQYNEQVNTLYLFDNIDYLEVDLYKEFCRDLQSGPFRNYILSTHQNQIDKEYLNIDGEFYIKGFSYYHQPKKQDLQKTFNDYTQEIAQGRVDNFLAKNPLLNCLVQMPRWYESLCRHYKEPTPFNKIVEDIIPFQESNYNGLAELAYNQVVCNYEIKIDTNLELEKTGVIIKNEEKYEFVNDFFLYYFLAKYFDKKPHSIGDCLKQVNTDRFNIYYFIYKIAGEEIVKDTLLRKIKDVLINLNLSECYDCIMKNRFLYDLFISENHGFLTHVQQELQKKNKLKFNDEIIQLINGNSKYQRVFVKNDFGEDVTEFLREVKFYFQVQLKKVIYIDVENYDNSQKLLDKYFQELNSFEIVDDATILIIYGIDILERDNWKKVVEEIFQETPKFMKCFFGMSKECVMKNYMSVMKNMGIKFSVLESILSLKSDED